MNVINSAEKVDEKNGVICLSVKFRSSVIDVKLSKKAYFVQFTAEFSKKPESVKAIYINVSESSHYTLSENGMV